MHFLKLDLINLQSSDEKLEKLEATTLALIKLLEEDPKRAIPYTLIALDPKAPEDDKTVKEIISVLARTWTTYFNTFSGTPVQVVRALALQALVTEAENNQLIALVLVLIARNALPYMEVGNEAYMWTEIVAKFEARSNTLAEQEWTTPDKIAVKAFSYSPPKSIHISSSDVKIDREALQIGIEKATAPQNSKNQPTNGNPNWVNNAQAWSNEFSNRMVSAISNEVDKAFEQAKVEPINLSKPLKELTVAVTNHIDATLEAVSNATAGLQRRSNLIWWRESLYSQSASCSYRKMPMPIAATIMAFDLANMIPIFSPASVTAFLHESTSLIIKNNTNEIMELGQRIEDIKQSEYTEPLRNYIKHTLNKLEGRSLLLNLVAFNINLDEAQFRKLTGLAINTQISDADWSTWVFRELQSIKAVVSGEKDSE